MIEFSAMDSEATPSDVSIDDSEQPRITNKKITLDKKQDSKSTEMRNLKREKTKEQPVKRLADMSEEINYRSSQDVSSNIMTSYITVVIKKLKQQENKDAIPAAESGEIVRLSKFYLNTMSGNPIARKYIASTMLITRNNYRSLDEGKREKLIQFIDSYNTLYDAEPSKVQEKLYELYSHGIKPL